METKYKGGDGHAGKSITLDKHPKVLEYDDAGTDEGARIVVLVPGWAFMDAAKNEGDDPEGRMALHAQACGSVKEALQDIRNAQPCKCGYCLSKL